MTARMAPCKTAGSSEQGLRNTHFELRVRLCERFADSTSAPVACVSD